MEASERVSLLEQAVALEREAHQLRSQQKIQEAFNTYDRAAILYSNSGEHSKAALCYASAASCWNIHTGIQPLRNAATRTHQAAQAAMRAGSYHYARSLFLDAALLYEKEGDFGNYSACFYESKRSEAKLCWTLFAHGLKQESELSERGNWRERFLALGRWTTNSLNFLIWGYGEKPFRTFVVAFFLITLSAVAYSLSGRISFEGAVRPISFLEGIYLSVITYTTVGFGDYLPLGWTRAFAMLEALSGIFLAPLFLVGLTRRYLRMYR